jgi:lysine 2,3-aminomutase
MSRRNLSILSSIQHLSPAPTSLKPRIPYSLLTYQPNPTQVSGGDSYYLPPEQLRYIGDALLSIPHIQRFRIATKGLCVSPSRTLDSTDTWTSELIRLSNRGRERGVQVALHTHFNHTQEMSWVTREAAQRLFESGVVVRNQSVLLRGVNDDVATMGRLVRELADMNVQPACFLSFLSPFLSGLY